VDEESLGYLPGTLENKMDPWTRPIFDIFHEYYSKQEVEKMMYNGIIEISPLAYMRGRTFKNSWIIADEMQNSSPTQMLMMTTRLGIGSKLVITGDLQQSDKIINHPHNDHIIQQSGLKDFIDRYNYYNKYVEETEEYDMQTPQIRIAYMNTSDIRRSPIVAKILKIYKGNAV
jgi:phosphate starvation-inducible PhoH-like protein